jgi:hypothetical protein
MVTDDIHHLRTIDGANFAMASGAIVAPRRSNVNTDNGKDWLSSAATMRTCWRSRLTVGTMPRPATPGWRGPFSYLLLRAAVSPVHQLDVAIASS